jgi:hypothetical protein
MNTDFEPCDASPDELLEAATSSTSFWDNLEDDADWNDA